MRVTTFCIIAGVMMALLFVIGCNSDNPAEPIASKDDTTSLAKKVKLKKGKIKIDGLAITDRAGNPVATKRVTILWRYSDVNGDGVFTWEGAPEVGDVFRLVNRAIYDFTADFAPDPNWNGQIATFHWGPFDPATNSYRPTVFRGVFHDDFLPGLPVPGDFVVTQGPDGLPVPGLSLTASLFIDSGDWDPNNGSTPVTEPRWGIRYILKFAPGTPRVIPAGTFMFMDSQLDMQNIATTTCENGWSEEDWITTGGVGGFVQHGPSTARPSDFTKYPKLEAPLLQVPVGHPCF
ncbi:MAG: hypothetical protein ACE5IY_07720 [bacterium]